MSDQSEQKVSINSWLEDELYQQYLHDPRTVDESWKPYFKQNGATGNGAVPGTPLARVQAPAPKPIEAGPNEELVPLRGPAARIAENMAESLSVPTATSQRVIPVKLIDENRRMLNQHRGLTGQSKISYTHLIAWGIVRALNAFPNINNAFTERNGEPHRVVRREVNLGLAIDVAGKDGNRSLLVPSIKNAAAMNFHQFLAAYDSLVAKARSSKLAITDFQGTTISLTNPGTVGTVGSVPRLMPGQGAIIATGAIDFPAEYQGVAQELRAQIGLGKVMMVSCTYDHRIIQGAESGAFLGRLHELLQGEDSFYDSIFADLKMPYHPVQWQPDRQPAVPGLPTGRLTEAAKQAAVLQLINAYRVRGHLIADLDPLGAEVGYHPELDPETYSLGIWDLDREFLTGSLATRPDGPGIATLREILETLRQTYCGKLGCEYMNIQHPDQKQWLQARMEPYSNSWALGKEVRVGILTRLLEAEAFEHFLHSRFVGHKRFSLEGGETAMAILDHLIERAADTGVQEIVIGMAHRGRLNVLSNLIGKALIQVFSEFEGNLDPFSTQGSGDVKYHLGAHGTRTTSSGKDLSLFVSPNPSHLEAVDPVVEGIVRPKQDRIGDTLREKIIPLLIHGDAAFAGQGVVAETLNLSQLEGYTTGGTVHLIINNQIGFTTRPDEARSTAYSTDVARMVQAPIFHVNGDDPEAAIRATQLALDFRQAFKKDVVIDMICYRRHGHNEADEPSFTQPIMYRKIRQQPSVATLYGERLLREKLVAKEDIDGIRKGIMARLEEGYQAAVKGGERYAIADLAAVPDEEITPVSPQTAVDRSVLDRVIAGITSFPDDFHLHPKLKNWVEKRKEVLNGAPMEWALGETFAFGSLLLEGTPVRLSGQDSGRGTFVQRHLEFYDHENGAMYVPLAHLDPKQARFQVIDSSLSEYAVMGFEFGYSLGDPLALVMWEAQFGDFVNGAQIMIDQFISAAESKWGQPSGLVLLLPHGYEGQGPEHSSARIERFLQLCAENNMQVANCTTPAQYFHLLRRQIHGGHDRRGTRKPLIVFTPKSLLRHPRAVSTVDELTSGGFHEVLPDTAADSKTTTRVAFCSGKIYYELLQAREEKGAGHVALVRIEQLYPFAQDQVQAILAKSPSAELLWVQEEPRNMGAWRHIEECMRPLLDGKRGLRYVGRLESASPSAGSAKRHQQEQSEIVEETFAAGPLPKKARPRRKR